MFTFDPFDPAQTHAIADTARKLAAEAPVLRLQNGFVIVSRYDDARQVLTHGTVFANAGGFRPNGLDVPIEDRTLGELDPPEHGPIRRLAMGAAAGPGAVELLKAFTRENSRALLDSILARGQGDLVGDFSVVLTNRVIAKLLGSPQENCDWLADQAETILSSDMPVTNRTENGFGYKNAFPEFHRFHRRSDPPAPRRPGYAARCHLAHHRGGGRQRRDAAGDDHPHGLDSAAVGGSATTRDFLGNIFHELILQPELHAAIRNDPALVPVAVEKVCDWRRRSSSSSAPAARTLS